MVLHVVCDGKLVAVVSIHAIGKVVSIAVLEKLEDGGKVAHDEPRVDEATKCRVDIVLVIVVIGVVVVNIECIAVSSDPAVHLRANHEIISASSHTIVPVPKVLYMRDRPHRIAVHEKNMCAIITGIGKRVQVAEVVDGFGAETFFPALIGTHIDHCGHLISTTFTSMAILAQGKASSVPAHSGKVIRGAVAGEDVQRPLSVM